MFIKHQTFFNCLPAHWTKITIFHSHLVKCLCCVNLTTDQSPVCCTSIHNNHLLHVKINIKPTGWVALDSIFTAIDHPAGQKEAAKTSQLKLGDTSTYTNYMQMFQDREVLIPSWASIRFGLNSSVPAGVLYWQQQYNNILKSQLCNGRGNNTRSVLRIQLRDILTQLLHITWVVLCYTCNLNQAVGNEPANGRTSILLFPVQNCPIVSVCEEKKKKISWTDFDLSSFDEFVV